MAPTGLTLPDGRMWGMVDIDEMLGIIDHTVSPVAVAARCRGWIGAAPGPAQMAERAVFASLDSWDFDTQPRTARVVDDEGSSRVEVTTSQRRWSVDVDVGRGVPTIACGAPGGLPAKPATEWRIAAITELVDGAPDRPVSL